MLVVLARCPVAAPLEACLNEKLEAEVVVGDLVGEVPRAVTVGLGGGWLYEASAVIAVLVVGVVKGVDVHRQTTSVL